MTTSPQQISLFIEDKSTFLPEDSHVSHIAQPAKEKAQKMTAISGRKCLEQYERFNRATLWGKTFAALLIGTGDWYSTKCNLIWKLRATKSHRLWFQLAVSTRPIEETEFGLLPTVSAMDHAGPKNLRKSTIEGFRKGWKKDMSLTHCMMMELLPTPQATDFKGGGDSGKLRGTWEGPGKRFENMGIFSKENWQNFPTQSPICGRDDGLPSELDGITFSKWRQESIKGYGNAIVPQVAYEIFKVIEMINEQSL